MNLGMFLWVYLVLEILKEDVTIGDLRTSIASLPEDLAGAYDSHIHIDFS